MQPALPSASPGGAGRAAAALSRAEAAAKSHLQQAPQATGERLRTNFLTVMDTVQQHDGHLLAQLETDFISAYKVGLSYLLSVCLLFLLGRALLTRAAYHMLMARPRVQGCVLHVTHVQRRLFRLLCCHL